MYIQYTCTVYVIGLRQAANLDFDEHAGWRWRERRDLTVGREVHVLVAGLQADGWNHHLKWGALCLKRKQKESKTHSHVQQKSFEVHVQNDVNQSDTPATMRTCTCTTPRHIVGSQTRKQTLKGNSNEVCLQRNTSYSVE